MSLHTDIKTQMVEAMRAKDTVRLNVLRGLLSAFTNELVAKSRKPDEMLGDEEALAVISRAVKQRKDSIEQFEKGGRTDLADSEKAELEILQHYLPAQMSREEIESYVKNLVNSPSFAIKNKGEFMGLVMKELKGKADGTLVKEALDKVLG